MKIKSVFCSAVLVFTSAAFISSAPASAGECSVEDPCQTYAMVDASGAVTNTIVCQPSVCGSGSFAGSRVVPQVAANPQTGENQGGFLGDPASGNIVRESNGTFYVNNENVVKQDNEISATFSSTVSSFTFQDTVNLENPSAIPMKEETPELNTSVTITAIETTTAVKETVFFAQRTKFETVSTVIEDYRLQVIQKRLARLQKLLAQWYL